MKVRELYRNYLHQLQSIYNANETALITTWLFESITGIARFDMIKDPATELDIIQEKRLNECLTELLRHKPVQYITGEAWFYKMKFFINEHVLIPRPETEELVGWLIKDIETKRSLPDPAAPPKETTRRTRLQSQDAPFLVLDIGTGSGCIAIAIKNALPGEQIYAIDTSGDALTVAKRNAGNHQAAIEFLMLDFLDENSWESLPIFDRIISNPPYIPYNEKSKLDKNVSDFEPPIALFVPDDEPLLFYKKIAAFSKKHLAKTGVIYVEIHEDLAEATAAVFAESFVVEIKQDIYGKERILIAAAVA